MSVIIDVEVTSYTGQADGKLLEETTTRQQEVELRIGFDGEGWLHFTSGPESMPFESIDEAILRGGWSANAGSPPVYIEPCPNEPAPCGPDCGCGPNEPSGWGGRNYPKIFVGPAALTFAQEELSS